jgi:hypothetical protein
MSSVYNNAYRGINAINGGGKFTHTQKGVNQWWKANFGGEYSVVMVKIRNRIDCCG